MNQKRNNGEVKIQSKEDLVSDYESDPPLPETPQREPSPSLQTDIDCESDSSEQELPPLPSHAFPSSKNSIRGSKRPSALPRSPLSYRFSRPQSLPVQGSPELRSALVISCSSHDSRRFAKLLLLSLPNDVLP